MTVCHLYDCFLRSLEVHVFISVPEIRVTYKFALRNVYASVLFISNRYKMLKYVVIKIFKLNIIPRTTCTFASNNIKGGKAKAFF